VEYTIQLLGRPRIRRDLPSGKMEEILKEEKRLTKDTQRALK